MRLVLPCGCVETYSEEGRTTDMTKCSLIQAGPAPDEIANRPRNEIIDPQPVPHTPSGNPYVRCACGWLAPEGSRFCGNAAHAGNIAVKLRARSYFPDDRPSDRRDDLYASGAALDAIALTSGGPARLCGETDEQLRRRLLRKIVVGDSRRCVPSCGGTCAFLDCAARKERETALQIFGTQTYQVYRKTGAAKADLPSASLRVPGYFDKIRAERKAAGVCPECGDKTRESAVGVCRDHGRFFG